MGDVGGKADGEKQLCEEPRFAPPFGKRPDAAPGLGSRQRKTKGWSQSGFLEGTLPLEGQPAGRQPLWPEGEDPGPGVVVPTH